MYTFITLTMRWRAQRNTPVTLYRDYTELARRCEISQSAVGSPKNPENRCILFSIFTPRRCHGVPTAFVAFLRRFHGVLSRSCGVLVGDRLRAHGVSTACTPRVRSGHRARTASTPRWRRPIFLSLKQRAVIWERDIAVVKLAAWHIPLTLGN